MKKISDLELHYVVSYQNGVWNIASDTEDALFVDGTIYDWDTNTWGCPSNFSEDNETLEEAITTFDTSALSVLHSALRLLNEGV